MTQAQRYTTQTAYHGEVYGIDLLDHTSVMGGAPKIVVNDYVGKTRQRGRKRENQHRDDQPWSDLIVGSPRVLWEGTCTEDELDRVERYFIRDTGTRPRMNWLMNEDNPQQIPKWVQLEQRHARDDAAGRSRWVPPKERPDYQPDRRAAVPRSRVAPAGSAVVRRCGPWQVKVALWAGVWTVTTVLVWAWLDRLQFLGAHGPRWHGAVAVAGAGWLLVWAVRRKPATARRRKSQVRHYRR